MTDAPETFTGAVIDLDMGSKVYHKFENFPKLFWLAGGRDTSEEHRDCRSNCCRYCSISPWQKGKGHNSIKAKCEKEGRWALQCFYKDFVEISVCILSHRGSARPRWPRITMLNSSLASPSNHVSWGILLICVRQSVIALTDGQPMSEAMTMRIYHISSRRWALLLLSYSQCRCWSLWVLKILRNQLFFKS